MKVSEFQELIRPVIDLVSNTAIDAALADELNRRFPPGGETFDAIERACHEAIAAGTCSSRRFCRAQRGDRRAQRGCG